MLKTTYETFSGNRKQARVLFGLSLKEGIPFLLSKLPDQQVFASSEGHPFYEYRLTPFTKHQLIYSRVKNSKAGSLCQK